MSSSTGYTLSSLTPQSQGAFNAGNNRLLASGYDNAGNQTVDAQSRTFTYDAENRQITFNGTTRQYFYDHRVKKIDGSGTTVFVYNAGGQLIAEYHSDPVPPPAGGGGTSYLTTDHLGSTRVVTKADGTVKARYDYLPFGEELGSTLGQRTTGMGYSLADSTNQKFTQKERDNESGLDYFLARYYSSAQGRFTSPDEFTGGPDDLFYFAETASKNPTLYGDLYEPQSLNKYQYCYNNPLQFVDPDGHGVTIRRKRGSGGTTAVGIALQQAANNPIPNPVVGVAMVVVGVGALVVDWGANSSDSDSDSKDKSGPPPAPDSTTQAQPQTQGPLPPGGGKDSRKVNRKREQTAKEKAEELRTQRDLLKSKPNKTPLDKANLEKLENALKQQLERMKKSEAHSRRPKGRREIAPEIEPKKKARQAP